MPEARAPAGELGAQLTLVLLTYNCAHRLGPILERAVALSVPVVAVDNASTDDTVSVLRAAAPAVDIVRQSINLGAAGRNLGADHARTPYVAFCDDDGWYERDGLAAAVAALERNPRLALVNARILVGPEGYLDPISAEMADSPLPDEDGIPGAVLLSFMGGAAVVRREAYLEVGGYDERFFIGGEEETLAMKLARRGWHMRYLADVVMHHEPSIANAPRLRPFGLRNTIWNTWLHRRAGSAWRWTLFTLADTPKNGDWLRGVAMTLRGLGWVLRERDPMTRELDRAYAVLDARRFAVRRSVFGRQDPLRELVDAGRTVR